MSQPQSCKKNFTLIKCLFTCWIDRKLNCQSYYLIKMPMHSPLQSCLLKYFSVSIILQYVPASPSKPLSSLLPCGNVSEYLMYNVIELRLTYCVNFFLGLLSDIKAPISVLSMHPFNSIKPKGRTICLFTHSWRHISVHIAGPYSSSFWIL